MNPVFKLFLTITAEQQPCGLQVVERVGLVASGFLFKRHSSQFAFF